MTLVAHSHDERRVAPGSHGDILALVSSGQASTIAELAELTRLVRSTVTQRVNDLAAHGLLAKTEPAPAARKAGRPVRRIRLNTDDNLILAIDLGASHCRMAVMDISSHVLGEKEIALETTQAAREDVLPRITKHMHDLLRTANRPDSAVQAIGMGVPAPIDWKQGKPSNPPILGPGWNGYPIKNFLADAFSARVRVLVDNDVNIAALGEHRTRRSGNDDLMVVKAGTGIGCGIIAGGRLHRGAQGAAGDIGHIQVTDANSHHCHCGKTGCLEAVAGGTALARALSRTGHRARSPADVITLAADGNPAALQALQQAGHHIGTVLAALVNFFNPEVIAIAGVLSQSHHLIAAINERIRQQSLPLATTNLRIEPAMAGASAAVTGAGILAIEHILDPLTINLQLAQA